MFTYSMLVFSVLGHYIAKIDDKSNRLNISNITLAGKYFFIIKI